MIINVSKQAQEHFWDEPPADYQEFWAFRFKPMCCIGDKIYFVFDEMKTNMGKRLAVAVAEAIVSRIESPRKSMCDTGKFLSGWKVFWLPKSFRDLRCKQSTIENEQMALKF